MKLIGSIDQGTTSTRFILFDVDRDFSVVASHQIEFQSIVSQPGWCEHDPLVILDTVRQCIAGACESLEGAGDSKFDLVSIGITNQRETTVAWDKETGQPLCNALVWMDTRTKTVVEQLSNKHPGLSERTKAITGLPVSTYFSALKMRWMLDNIPQVSEAAHKGTLKFGTVDSWLIWHLTSGKSHVTDVTNASRTLLMNLTNCQWDRELLDLFDINKTWLPEIKASCSSFGTVNDSNLKGVLSSLSSTTVTINGVLGDQQASLVGHQCFNAGQAKNTYGTGCFMLFNTGKTPVFSSSGLLTTVAYKLGDDSPSIYAMEGSIATAGSAIVWLRDKINLISTTKEIGELASQVTDTAGVFFVPALTGLLAPYWDPDAKGVITGMSMYTTKHHICRALLEAISYQTKEIVESIENDAAHVKLAVLKVDGGLTNSDVFVQIQSDILGIQVSRPEFREMTALGAAYAAGLGRKVLRMVISHGHEHLVVSDTGRSLVQKSSARFDPNKSASFVNVSGWKESVKKSLSKKK